MKKKNLGYGDSRRLADVMALIQVLALGKDTKRSENGLKDELQRKPLTEATWSALAQRHPEFFRVREEDANDSSACRVSLVARAAMPKFPDGHRDPIPNDLIGKLLDIAISIHDREVARGERWKSWFPIFVAFIGGFFAVIVVNLQNGKLADTRKIIVELPATMQSVTQNFQGVVVQSNSPATNSSSVKP
jgi:hypothetical protein